MITRRGLAKRGAPTPRGAARGGAGIRRALLAAPLALLIGIGTLVPGTLPAAFAAPTPTPGPAAPAQVDPPDPVREAEYWLEANGIREAWKTTRGAGVTIAVIDSGIAKGPVEFEDAVIGGIDVSGVGTPDGRTPVGVR